MSNWSLTDPDSVAANAAGRLTQQQRERLRRRPSRWIFGYPLAVLALLLAGEVLAAVWANWLLAAILLAPMATTVLSGLPGARRRYQIRRDDYRQPRVERGIGVLRCDRHGSWPTVPGRHLTARRDLPPVPTGWYELHWLVDPDATAQGRYGTLLSAAPPPPGWPAPWSPAQAAQARAALAGVLDCTADDLVANRAGALSPRQRRRLARQRRGDWYALGFVTLAGLTTTVLVVVALVQPGQSGWVRWIVVIPLGGLIGFVLLGTRAVRQAAAHSAALRAATPVLRLAGPLVPTPGGDDPDILTTPGLTFVSDGPIAAAFVPDRRYLLYYLARPVTLLAAEPDTRPH
jgi:hypothetical protein